jgi:hypothetical protein
MKNLAAISFTALKTRAKQLEKQLTERDDTTPNGVHRGTRLQGRLDEVQHLIAVVRARKAKAQR